MGSRLFVGNLPYSATEDELKSVFAAKWGVVDVRIVTDRETGRSRGFGFVELDSPDSAAAAIAEMDGNDLGGRPLAVREAHERQGGRRPNRRFDGASEVAVDSAPRRGRPGFRGDGPPRRGNGARRFDGPPPGAFAPPPISAMPDFEDGAKSRRRERRKKKQRHDSDDDYDL